MNKKRTVKMINLISTAAITIMIITGCGQPTKMTIDNAIIQPTETSIYSSDSVEIYQPKTLPGNAHAQQGTCIMPDGKFLFTENFDEAGRHKSRISIVSPDLKTVLFEKVIDADLPLWSQPYSTHVGQPAFRVEDGFIYMFVMDLSTPYDRRRTGILKFNTALQFQRFIDLSGTFTYLDAIAFQSGRIWLDYGVICSLDFNELLRTERVIDWVKYDYDTSTYSISQGLQIKDGKLYAVPECDPETPRTKPGKMGLIVYDLASLRPRTSGNKIINNPERNIYFELPEKGKADHEAMDFVLGKSNEFWISSAADGGLRVYKVRMK